MKKISKCFFVYSVVRIYSCYCNILRILYITEKKKKRNFVYFEWLKLRQL